MMVRPRPTKRKPKPKPKPRAKPPHRIEEVKRLKNGRLRVRRIK